MTVEGRFGYYPCDYATYVKLKRLNLLCLRGRRRLGVWERWNAKEPQNRVRWRYPAGHAKKRHVRVADGQLPQPLLPPYDRVEFDMVYAQYRRARFPQLDKAAVVALDVSAEIVDAMLERMEVWDDATYVCS